MDTCEDLIRFAKAREKWLKNWVALPNGIPCANTFLRLFAAIDPAVFGECLIAYVTTLAPDLKGRLVNIEGKTLRGSRKADESTVQIVSAWAQHNGLTLAQQAVDKNRHSGCDGRAAQNRDRNHPPRGRLPPLVTGQSS